MAELLVVPCPHKAARYAVEHWHYSRRMPNGAHAAYGVWEGDLFIGAIVFARGVRTLLDPYGLDQTQGAELARVALRGHRAPVSQIVTLALRRLRADNPRLRLVVSFADPAHGHHGGIYQAMGWVYAGRTAAGVAYRDKVDPSRVYHRRSVARDGWLRQFGKVTRVKAHADLDAVRLPPKHRYLYPLDRGMRRQVAALSQPYPRGRGVDGDAPAVPAGEASSTLADRSV